MQTTSLQPQDSTRNGQQQLVRPKTELYWINPVVTGRPCVVSRDPPTWPFLIPDLEVNSASCSQAMEVVEDCRPEAIDPWQLVSLKLFLQIHLTSCNCTFPLVCPQTLPLGFTPAHSVYLSPPPPHYHHNTADFQVCLNTPMLRMRENHCPVLP